MRIQPVDLLSSIDSIKRTSSASAKPEAGATGDVGSGFKQQIEKAIGNVNHLQSEADQTAVKLASGDIEDVHEAMIAMQKAKLALDFTIQVRNKGIEAYQEIMRMQV